MKCETAHDSDLEEDDEESDEEIIQLREKIKKKKMARKRRSEKEDLMFSNTLSSPPMSSTGTSISSGSPRSSYLLSTFSMLHFYAVKITGAISSFYAVIFGYYLLNPRQ